MKHTLTYTTLFIIAGLIASFAFVSVQAQDSLLVETSESSIGADIVAQKFINQIAILSSVKINADFFTDESFRSFVDWSRELPTEQKGRNNPFAPLN